jgi:hypothetical protein
MEAERKELENEKPKVDERGKITEEYEKEDKTKLRGWKYKQKKGEI